MQRQLATLAIMIGTLTGCNAIFGLEEVQPLDGATGTAGNGGTAGTGGDGGDGTGASFVNDYAVAIDGVDGWVDGGDMAALFDGATTVGAFTISFWVHVNDTPDSGSGLVSVGPPAGGGLQMYWSNATGSQTVALSVETMTTTAHAEVENGEVTIIDTWHHVAGVYDRNSITVYVNGEPGDSVAAPTSSVDVDGIIYMGRFYDGPGLRLDGRLDEVALYATALDVDDVAAIVQLGRNADVSTAVSNSPANGLERLVAHWRMGDDVAGMGVTMVDRIREIEAALIAGASFVTAD